MKKKLVITLIVLIIIIITLLFLFNKNKNNTSLEEKTYDKEIETYISEIYGNMFTLPEFDDINNANDNWLWDNLLLYIGKTKKLTSTYYSRDELTNFAKELYGEHLNKEFPEEGSDFIIYNPVDEKYMLAGYGLEYIMDFAIVDIKPQDNNIYDVIIVEYKIDSFGISEENEESGVGSSYDLYNMKNEKITQFDSSYNSVLDKIKKYVIENKEQFTEKKIVLKLNPDLNMFNVLSSTNI